jgi:hypothetical protein
MTLARRHRLAPRSRPRAKVQLLYRSFLGQRNVYGKRVYLSVRYLTGEYAQRRAEEVK